MGSERLTELLATGIAQLAVEVNRESQTQCFNWLFPAWCSAQPLLPLKITNLTSANSINTGWSTCLNQSTRTSTRHGRRAEMLHMICTTTSKMMERFFERANEIHSSIKTVLEQEGALTDEEIQEIADKEGLQQLREKFTDLEEELEREAVE